MKIIGLLIYCLLLVVSNVTKANESSLVVEVQKGDTFSKILNDIGLSAKESFLVVKELSKSYDPTSLKLKDKIMITVKESNVLNEIYFKSLSIELPSYEEIIVSKNVDGSYFTEKKVIPRDLMIVKAQGEIESSLFASANEAKIPVQVVLDLIKIYSYDIDFQRDIKKGNNFEILYEQYFDRFGNQAGTGELIYTSLNTRGENFRAYNFVTEDGFSQYFDENGKSVKKSFLKTPVDGARITSGYGKRRHPILGYNKMHKGIDFGAPTGTPVYAAGNGFIKSIGRNGGYGKYIKIRHSNGYSTAYAHLNGYKKGLKKGSRVKQGQVIGYVGSTGRSTGAHLHYEILVNNKHINPLSVKAEPETKLKGLSFGIFTQYKKQIDAVMRKL